jgi:hypothetical protein
VNGCERQQRHMASAFDRDGQATLIFSRKTSAPTRQDFPLRRNIFSEPLDIFIIRHNLQSGEFVDFSRSAIWAEGRAFSCSTAGAATAATIASTPAR